jgi:alpha-1,6-mannosyltransferase
MRIVHVANFYGARSGGLRTTMHALGAGYRAAGHEPVLVVPGASQTREETPYGLRITLPGRELPGTGGYRVMTDRALVHRTLDEVRPDRLEVSDRTTLRGLGEWARARHVPSLVWAHERVDGVLAATVLRGRGGAAVARRVADGHNRATAASFDRVVCTTAYAAEEFHRIGAGNVVRVPLGVDLRTFTPDAHDPGLRARWVEPGQALLVLCSRLSPEKRPELAVHALAVLLQRGIAARLVVAGSGPREDALRAETERLGLPVTMLGFVHDRARLSALLATADVVLAPGPIETFGLAALEALASGTPVVAARTSALAEIVGPDAGAVADPTAQALAAAVTTVLARDVRQRRAGARRRAEQMPWSRTVSTMLALHDAPLARRQPSTLAPTCGAALVRASHARTLPANATARRLAGDGPRVVGLGDSVTLGVGDLVEPGQHPGWAAHVAHAVGAGEYTNLARLGARARTVVEEQLRVALARRPDVALLAAGGNDVLRGDLDPDDVAASIERCVQALRAVGSQVVLVRLSTCAHVRLLPPRLRRVLDHRVGVVNEGLDTVAAATGVPALTLQPTSPLHPQLWHVDRIHPGPLGHRVLAQQAVSELAAAGVATVATVPPLTLAAPSRPAQVEWLLRNGVPWLAKRSVDLFPALGWQLVVR